MASPQSYAVTKCLLMLLLFSYLCLLSNKKMHIYIYVCVCLIELKRHNDASQNKPDVCVDHPGNSGAVRVKHSFLKLL